MKARDRVQFVLLTCLFCLVLPYAAWLLASSFYRFADLRGPFLLISPLLAVCVVSFVGSYFRTGPPNKSVEHGELSAEINSIADKLGAGSFQVFAQPSGAKPDDLPASVEGTSVFVYLSTWPRWNPEVRTYMVAYLLAGHSREATLDRKWSVAVTALAIVGCFLSALNLWLILFVHSGSLLAAWYVGRHEAMSYVTTSDRLALQVTRNYHAAHGFAAWHCQYFRPFGSGFAAKRLACLKAEAISLGLNVNTATP